VDSHVQPPRGWDAPKADDLEDFRVVVEQAT
jgi:hypothetical protein